MSVVPGGCQRRQGGVRGMPEVPGSHVLLLLHPLPCSLAVPELCMKRGCRSGREAPTTRVCHKGPCRERVREKTRQASSSSASNSSPTLVPQSPPCLTLPLSGRAFHRAAGVGEWHQVPSPGEEREGTTPPPSISCPISELQPHLVGNKHPMERHAWPAKVSSQHLISHGQGRSEGSGLSALLPQPKNTPVKETNRLLLPYAFSRKAGENSSDSKPAKPPSSSSKPKAGPTGTPQCSPQSWGHHWAPSQQHQAGNGHQIPEGMAQKDPDPMAQLGEWEMLRKGMPGGTSEGAANAPLEFKTGVGSSGVQHSWAPKATEDYSSQPYGQFPSAYGEPGGYYQVGLGSSWVLGAAAGSAGCVGCLGRECSLCGVLGAQGRKCSLCEIPGAQGRECSPWEIPGQGMQPV
uniref:Proline rich mitotic checkpoint control factor n=1 Tax=Zonotrichia albicollis TaxID=44394 RepID=A0A8D2MDP1_ZONAL